LPPTASDRGYRPTRELIGYFLLACVLENQKVDDEDAIWDDRFAESEEAVIGVCWYCGAKLRDGYGYDVVCW
jgi:hypothetical protein